MYKQVLILLLAAFCGQSHAQDNGGIAAGMTASTKHEFGMEFDYLDRIATRNDPKQFDLLRYSFAASFWQAKDKGQDISLEAGYCRGFQWHGCIGVGIRKQNADTTCLQSTLEFGTGFLFSIFARPLFKIHETDQPRVANRHSDLESEFGVKFKWPLWTY